MPVPVAAQLAHVASVPQEEAKANAETYYTNWLKDNKPEWKIKAEVIAGEEQFHGMNDDARWNFQKDFLIMPSHDKSENYTLNLMSKEIESKCLGFSPQGTRLVFGDDHGILHLAVLRSGMWHKYFQRSVDVGNELTSLDFSSDGTRIATGGAGKKVHVLDSSSFEILYSIPSPEEGKVFACRFSVGSAQLAIGCSRPARVRIVSTPLPGQGNEVKVLMDEKRNDGVRYVAFSPCGSYLAAVSYDGMAGILRSSTGSYLFGH